MKKIRILAAGDFHGNKDIAKKLADLAEKENIDLVLLNGDIVEDNQPHGIVGYFVSKNKKVVLIPGNHESVSTIEMLSEIYKVKNLHNDYLIIGDVGIFGLSGVTIGFSALSEEEIFENLKKNFEKIKHLPKKIMLTHGHPSDTMMEKFSRFVTGSQGVKRAIDLLKPEIAICGHVHEAEGIEEKVGSTRLINVGKSGKIIEL